MEEFLNDPTIQDLMVPVIAGAIALIVVIVSVRFVIRSNSQRKKSEKENDSLRKLNTSLQEEIRNRIIDHVKYISRLILLNPVIPGNTPDDTSLEGRNRAKCLDLLMEALPQDTKGQGIRMAEFLHLLSDHLLKSYSKEEKVAIKIDADPIILDVESAISVGLMLTELISNAIQYGNDPDTKPKVNVFLKEREGKLVINVADNGIGMKVPYLPKYSFGLQLTATLVKLHKGDLIISSRPGTRVEILLTEYQTAIREVYITPTRRIY